MKKGMTKIILASISVIISLVFVVTSTVAWIISLSAINNLGFQVLQIDSQVNVYQGVDSNYNGIIDLLDEENINKYCDNSSSNENVIYSPYEKLYYDEIHDFELLDSKYALSLQSTANQIETIKLNNVAPGKHYTYKYEVTNYSLYTNFLSFSFISTELSSEMIDLLSLFEIRCGVVLDDGSVNYLFNWGKIVSGTEGNYSYHGISIVDGIEVSPSGKGNSDGRKDLWIQLRMRDDVSYNKITSSSVTFPDFFLELTALVEEE